ncbi:YybS family protein [Brevibacillus ruminantium]|uniref:YybS family protein n=1 Tax=Brevibacillus ruminantium TaxID=2950604 RepID=A0ABY4WFH3_9BACL|nr:DUF2232 domain-containing protein [Brevibacillus ruminantium]USG65778.1 YybS family protein [Brevibacillus ruminantium]
MPLQSKRLAEIALLLGIATALLILSTYTVAGVFTTLLLPLPFVFLGRRQSGSSIVWSIVIFTCVGGLLAGIAAAMMAVTVAIWGAVMGKIYAKSESAIPAIFAGAAAVFLGYLAILALSAFVFGVNLNDMFQRATEFKPPFMPQEQFDQGIQFVKMVMPAFLVLMSIIQSVVTHGLSRLLGWLIKSPVPALPPIREWSFPRSILYYYFICMISILLMSDEWDGSFWTSAVFNVKVMLDVVLTLQGLSFCLFAIHLYNRKVLAPVLIVSLFIFPPLTTILSLLGIFDLGINLRKRLETRVKRG